MNEEKNIDLEVTSIVIPGKVYAAVIDYLIKKFTYADIVSVVNELNKTAYTVDNSVVEKYSPANPTVEENSVEGIVEDVPKKHKK